MADPRPEKEDPRTFRIAGLVARTIAKAVHDAVLLDEATGTKHGQHAIADALLAFAEVLAANHFRGTDKLIQAARLARAANELLRHGGASIAWLLGYSLYLHPLIS